jgi:hypothetical protein
VLDVNMLMYVTMRHHAEVYDWAGLQVRELVTMRYDPTTTQILDVGAGHGKYRVLLPEYDDVDACEIWAPTIKIDRLHELYRTVFVCDVHDLVTSDRWRELHYDVVVLGDVLEHLPRARAQRTLEVLFESCNDVVVVVPYLYDQDVGDDGNTYQRHEQDDLTPELMAREYPDLRLVAVETREHRAFKGLYRRHVM